MVWQSQDKAAAQKLIRDSVLQSLGHINIGIFGSCEVDAIICISFGSGNNEEQLVVKVHEHLKRDHIVDSGGRNNNEGSLLREYLAGSASVLKPKLVQPHVALVSRKRKGWDENDNTIYAPRRKVLHTSKVHYAMTKREPVDYPDAGDNPLNLSDRFGEASQADDDKEMQSLRIENSGNKEQNGQWNSCGICRLICNSYLSLQDHFVERHSCNLRFFCSKCSTGFAEDEAHAKHCAQHSWSNQSASNRRKQSKPRKGITTGCDLTDDESAIPQQSTSNQNEMTPSKENHSFSGDGNESGLFVMDQNEGIVKSLLQKNSLPVSSMQDMNLALNSAKHSILRASPLVSFTTESLDASSSEYKCQHCGIKLESFELFSDHCKVVHKRFACFYCSQTFTQRVNRDRHLYNHTGEKPYECAHCGSGFTRRDALKKHQVRANHLPAAATESIQPRLKLSLPDCVLGQEDSEESGNEDVIRNAQESKDAEAADYSMMSQNREDDQSKQNSSYAEGASTSRANLSLCQSALECSILAEGTATEDGDMTDGEISDQSFHSGDIGNTPGSAANSRPASAGLPEINLNKSFKCDCCQESVNGTVAYTSHCKVKHRRTPCLFCGRTFSQKGNMERHVRQHTGERPFHCQFCQCSYTRKETLKVHINQAHSHQLNQELDNFENI